MTITPDLPLAARNEDFSEIVRILTEQQGRKLDVVAPATKISITPDTSQLVVSGTEAVMDESGVTPADGVYTATDVFWDGVTDKLQIPRSYLNRMREQRPDLLAANVNGWLHGKEALIDGNGNSYPADPRNFLLRLFRGDNGDGVARAMLSDTYRLSMDNLDVLTAALDGVSQAGVEVDITDCNLTEKRLHVRVEAPGVRALAPVLLAGYRNPFADPSIKRAGGWSLDHARHAAKNEGMGHDIGDEPIVWAGFDITNSETGGGAYRLTPVIKVGPCRNGLVIEADSYRKVHLGSRMDEGLFRAGADTQRKELELIALQARDAVATWLDVDYITSVVAKLEEKSTGAISPSSAMETIETVTRGLQFSKDEQAGVLAHFIHGGQLTAGGVMQAVTSYAQTVEDADRAFDIERAGLPALDAAYRLTV